jgi:hypothetical protein
MALNWKQEPRFSAKGTTGNYYKVFPFIPDQAGNVKYGASVTYLNEDGELAQKPIGMQYDTLDLAKKACEEEYAKAIKPS